MEPLLISLSTYEVTISLRFFIFPLTLTATTFHRFVVLLHRLAGRLHVGHSFINDGVLLIKLRMLSGSDPNFQVSLHLLNLLGVIPRNSICIES